MESLKIVVAGMGAIGIEHADIYASLLEAELVGVVDANPDVATEAGRRYGCRSFGSLDEVLASDLTFDAVSLCTPDHLHYRDAMSVIESGRHLLLEKPIATSYAEAAQLAEAAAAAAGVTMPGHTLRFEPRYHAAAQLVRSGTIGDVIHGYVRRDNRVAVGTRARGRVNVAWFLGIHDVDALLWITGLDIVEVQAMGTQSTESTGQQSLAVLANLRLSNGNVVQLEAAWALPDAYPTDLDSVFRLVGSKGEASVETFASGMRVAAEGFTYPMTAGAPMYGRSQGALHEELACFVRAAQQGAEPPVTMAEAAKAIRVVCAIEKALETGELVRVDSITGGQDQQ